MSEEIFKIDPHIHSKNSPCSRLTKKQIVFKACELDLDAVCITDHDMITKLTTDDNILILTGSEITTKDGHILAYGVLEPVPSLLTAEETIDKIHEQGGIAVAAHPYRKFNKKNSEQLGLGNNGKIFLCPLDGIETLNYLNNTKENNNARKTAQILDLPQLGGRDAHHMKQIGKVITILPSSIETIDDFIKNIKKGKTIPSFNL